MTQDFRIGHGYDLHRLEPVAQGSAPPLGRPSVPGQPTAEPTSGRPLVVGGVTIPHDCGPISHSDGDALYHAVTDAILGAIGHPDIGQLFPDTDPRHESADSSVFLAEAVARARAAGWTTINLDATVILERPKLSPHKEQIRANLARLLGIALDRVNLKGKTHERVDAVGEGRAIEVHAVVLLAQTSK